MAVVSGYGNEIDPAMYWAGAELYDPFHAPHTGWATSFPHMGVVIKNGKAYIYDTEKVHLPTEFRAGKGSHQAPQGIINNNDLVGSNTLPNQTSPQAASTAVNQYGSQNPQDQAALLDMIQRLKPGDPLDQMMNYGAHYYR